MILEKCFTDEFIVSKVGTNIDKKRIYEKVIYAFYLLEKIADFKYGFVFKGGTSLMLLLDSFSRFSVDIDILMNTSDEKYICEDVFSLKNQKFFKVEEDKRRPQISLKGILSFILILYIKLNKTIKNHMFYWMLYLMIWNTLILLNIKLIVDLLKRTIHI